MRECHGFGRRDIHTALTMGWHKKTNVVSPEITRENSGICYPFVKKRNYILDENGSPIVKEIFILDEDGEPTDKTEFHSVVQNYSIVSTDDMLPIGGTVGAGYQMISNDQIWDMLEESLSGTAHKIVSCGTIKQRSKCFASVKLSENIVAGNRETENVLNVLWGHGGVFSVMARSGLTVVVCRNTFNMALNSGGEFSFKMKHTGSAKLENMGAAIDAHYGVVGEFKIAMDSLEAQACNVDTARALFAGFLVRGNGSAELPEIEALPTRTENTIDTLTTLFNKGDGNRGQTLCDTFNAFTDYYSHKSSGGKDRYRQFESSEFGSGARNKTEAYNLLTGRKVAKLGDFETVLKRGSKVLELV